MFIVVSYDISDDRRRTRLHQTLKNFCTPVQYSVFECILDEGQLRRMKEVVGKVIKKDTDLVRYYSLCKSCQRNIEATAHAMVTQSVRTLVI